MSPSPADLFATLVDRAAARRRDDDARASHLRDRIGVVARDLRARGVVDAVWLIGSLAWGGFGAHSDVDVVVRGVRAEDFTDVAATLAAAVDCALDVVPFERSSASFRARIETEGARIDEP